MKKTKIIIILMLLTSVSSAQDIQEIKTNIGQVTVFLNKAQIIRKGNIQLAKGNTILKITNLSPFIDGQSVQVKGKGNFTILGIEPGQNYLKGHQLPKAMQVLKDSVQYYRRQLNLEKDVMDIYAKEEKLLLSNQVIGGKDQNLTVSELKSMADFFRNRLAELGELKRKAVAKTKRYNERIGILGRQLSERNSQFSRNVGEILVNVSSDSYVKGTLELSYIVNNAGWQPAYDIRVVSTSEPVKLYYKANVFQNTGVDWDMVKLTLSTGNPSLSGQQPVMHPWYVNLYAPKPARFNRYKYEKKKLSGASYSTNKEDAVDSELIEEVVYESEADDVSNYISTVETTLNTEFAISIPYSVTSAGKPTTVDVKKYDVPASFVYSVVPKVDKDAFLLANVTGWEEFNLLQGDAAIFFEGTYVGKSYIDPNSVEDTLKLSLGRDKRVIVKREKLKDFSSKKLIGTNKKEVFAYEIQVKNTKNEPIELTLADQLPVSRNSEIDVKLVDNGSGKYDETKGFLDWKMELKANEVKRWVYKYEVKYPKNKIVAGL